jgi:hypothetical protein
MTCRDYIWVNIRISYLFQFIIYRNACPQFTNLEDNLKVMHYRRYAFNFKLFKIHQQKCRCFYVLSAYRERIILRSFDAVPYEQKIVTTWKYKVGFLLFAMVFFLLIKNVVISKFTSFSDVRYDIQIESLH